MTYGRPSKSRGLAPPRPRARDLHLNAEQTYRPRLGRLATQPRAGCVLVWVTHGKTTWPCGQCHSWEGSLANRGNTAGLGRDWGWAGRAGLGRG